MLRDGRGRRQGAPGGVHPDEGCHRHRDQGRGGWPRDDVRGWRAAREARRRQAPARQGPPRRLRDSQRRGAHAGHFTRARARVRARGVRSARAQARRRVQGGVHVHRSNLRHGHRSVHSRVRRARERRVRPALRARS